MGKSIEAELAEVKSTQAQLGSKIIQLEALLAKPNVVTAPAISLTLNPGEIFVGTVFPKDGKPGYHLILCPDQREKVNHQDATIWAESLGAVLPNRRDLRLLWVNALEEFKTDRYYWSSEQFAANESSAWMQLFSDGDQYCYHKGIQYTACAVRKLPI